MPTSHLALYTKSATQKKWSILTKQLQEQGITTFLGSHLQKNVGDPWSKWLFMFRNRNTHLSIGTDSIHYLAHWYNCTWTNERAVEIPYFLQRLQHSKPEKTLEIGNTLSHYQPVQHTIVDKYESAPGVINEDILLFHPKKRFDLIVAVSTIEHIGWHEKERRAKKAIEAIRHVQTLLSPKGMFVFSIPVGVNPAIDSAVQRQTLPFSECIALVRNKRNHWRQVPLPQVRHITYNHPFPNANALIIATVRRKTSP